MRKLFFGILALLNMFFMDAQNIEIKGNDFIISGDGSNIPAESNGTAFGVVPVGGSLRHTFTITNLESGNPGIQVQNISVNSSDFVVTNNIRHLGPGTTESFDIAMEPLTEGVKNAIVQIEVKRRNNRVTYTFNLNGEGKKEIMISQYYENLSTDWIELKNISSDPIGTNSYYVGIYSNGSNLEGSPDLVLNTGQMEAGETILMGGNDMFDGDDLIVISTSSGDDTYANRVDIIGSNDVQWGNLKAFGKGGCSTETSHTDFDLNNWIEIPISEVDQASELQNISLGTYELGPITWQANQWTNNALPDMTRVAFIEENYDGNLGNIEACDLIINAIVNFNNGGKNSVIVHRNLTMNETILIGDQESLVMYDDNAIISGTLTKLENSTYRNSAYDFTYWSSPIVNGNISTVFSGVDPERIFYFDQSRTNSSDPASPEYYNSWVNASGGLVPGIGYAAEGLTGTIGIHSISFTGIPNNGLISANMFFWDDTNSENDFNLIGNPYPSAIDIEEFFDANSSVIDPAVYLWTHYTPVSNGNSGDFSSSDYATYNYTGGTAVGDGPVPGRNIGSSQGFFVRAVTSGTVFFNNSMRMADANDQFFKHTVNKTNTIPIEENRIWLNLRTNQGGFNQLLIGFMEGATSGFDRGYDAVKFMGPNKIGFYSKLGDKKMAIQAFGTFFQNQEITLGFDTKVSDRTFSISIGKTEGLLNDSGIYLTDHVLEVTHDLKVSPYIFEQFTAGSFEERFSLKFINRAVLNVSDNEAKSQVSVYNREDWFTVNSTKVIETIRLYDIQGKMVKEMHPREASFQFNEPGIRKGTILFMQLITDDLVQIQKKLVKQ